MLYTLTYPRRGYDERNLNKALILKLIIKHQSIIAQKMLKNKRYYDGAHDIRDKKKKENMPNVKVVCNHAKDISDTASGYFMGNPITYNYSEEQAEAIDKLTDAFDKANIDDVDSDNSLDMSVYGCAYEYIFVKEGETELAARTLEPEFAFIVCDDSIEQNELFGVYYRVEKDDSNGNVRYIATVMTENLLYEFILSGTGENEIPLTEEPKPHNLGFIPLIEYKNNKDNIGDFEQQIDLIDAYNTLMSDRVNDKEQFIDAILVIYGAILGDNSAETSEAKERLREMKLLELDTNAKAEYLTRTLDETGAETLRKAIKEDIYTFSHVPNLTDENFAGNSSGVAMEYKLLGLEMTLDEMIQRLKNGNAGDEKKEFIAKLESLPYRARIERLKQLQNQLDYVMQNVYEQEKAITTSHYLDLANEVYYRSIFDLQQRTQAAFSFGYIDPKQIDEMIHSQWSGKNYSSRIWGNTKTLSKTVKEELLINFVTGRSERETAEIIANKFAQSASNARRLIRTESAYMSSEATIKALKEAEVEEYQYMATLDLKTSEICRKLDLMIFKVADRKVGVNCPPMHPWCRSTIVAVVDRKYLEGKQRAAIDPATGKRIMVPSDMTYDEWYQKYVMGKDPKILEQMALRIPSEVSRNAGLSPVVQEEIEQAIKKLEFEYDIYLDEISGAELPKGEIFRTGGYIEDGVLKHALVFNYNLDYNKIRERAEMRYKRGKYAGRNMEDYIAHEVAHIIPFQNCVTATQYHQVNDEIKKSFVKGISGYANDTRDGRESLAEAFVRYRNGEDIPQNALQLIEKYITPWRRE